MLAGGAAWAFGFVAEAQSTAPLASAPAGSPGVEVVERSIDDLQKEMAAGRTTSRAIAAAHLARVAAYDKQGPALNAMIALNPRALDEADALDRERRDRGPRGPLHGIPIVIKDNYETVDLPTTGGSVALSGFMTGRDAFQVKKLRDAGAVILGKTNLHELAAGIITISSLGGQTRNPYDPSADAGRFERRHGDGGRRELRGGRDGQRYVWLDPDSRQPTTTCSACAALQGCRAAPASSRCPIRRTSADPSREQSPTWR